MEPTSYIPQGKLGSHRHFGKIIQVQTEFAYRPRQRLVSSVIVDGRTVHKVDRDWADDLAREENQLKLDIEIDRVHTETMALVVDRAAEFAEGRQPSPTPGGDGYEAATFRDTIEEVLRTCPYAMALYEFDQSGTLIFRRHFRDVVAEWDREFAALSAIVFGLPEIIRVGELRHGFVQFGAENLIVARIRGRAFGILTDPEANVGNLRNDFPEFFEAVYDASNPV
ncbi:MAG TPA: hypothetical protein VGB22_00580 [candidate division Zixibacteria bacterium]|jgi:hypothetical protein